MASVEYRSNAKIKPLIRSEAVKVADNTLFISLPSTITFGTYYHFRSIFSEQIGELRAHRTPLDPPAEVIKLVNEKIRAQGWTINESLGLVGTGWNQVGDAEEFSKDAARKFLVQKQLLLRNKGKNGTLNAVKSLECVQRDPINVIHCNQHLVLHNRVIDYSLSFLEDLLYKDRLLFEYWCNEKSIIPTEDFRYFRYRMMNPSQFHSPFYERIKRRKQELKDHLSLVLSEIRRQGPLSSRELKQSGKIRGRMATSVLNLLWDFGELMIHHEERNRRYYDLTERVLPAGVDNSTPSREEFEQFMVEKYVRAYGLADTRNWRFGWLPLKALQRKAMVKEMVDKGNLIPIRIEGVKHIYHIAREHLNLLKSPEDTSKGGVYFVAPLDNLLWNRKAVSEIFDFNYSWEVYKVPDRRIYGYYVMPILFDSQFVGRLDPKLDRKNSKLIVNSIWLEKDDLDIGHFLEAFSDAFQRFLEFHNVSDFTIKKSEPETLRKDLIDELKH